MTYPEALTGPLASLPDPLPLPPPRPRAAAPLDARISPPGSKSLTNRALLLAALARGTSTLRNALTDADDAQRMIHALELLGSRISPRDGALSVEGVGGRWKPPAGQEPLVLDLHNAGTATRFLAAAAVLSPRPITIDGNARMRQRPIAELGELLESLGADITYPGQPGYPPMCIRAQGPLDTSSTIDIPTTQSSQFISALLLIAPWIKGGLTIRLAGEITSASYIEMTVGLLQRLGATVKTSADMRVVRVAPPASADPEALGIPPFDYLVEPDASGATYFWAAAAMLRDARCTIPGLDSASLQGDSRFTDLLARMGAEVTVTPPAPGSPGSIQTKGMGELAPIMADMSDMPDAAMTLAVVASFAKGTSVLRGLKTLRVKESDRITAMQTELKKIGVECKSPVFSDHGAMTVTAPPSGVDCSPGCPAVHFDTYDDHRIAMSLALVALRRPNVFINHPQCVAKTYATYWRDFAQLT